MQTQELTEYQIEKIIPQSVVKNAQEYTQNYSPQTQSLENVLSSILPNKSEENQISRTRKHLGETAKTLSDAQVETIITEFKFLIDTWLDEYEKEVFGGVTLKEVLNKG